MLTIQQMIEKLDNYWQAQGCLLLPPYDLEKGAGTFHPATFLYSLGKEKANVAYVEPSRRPTDGRFGLNPNRFLRFHQYQVLLKPCPKDCQKLYLDSLKALGLDLNQHDIRFVHDDWASPTIGASGLGWEVWCDGMEITQFTYFQQVGSISCPVISCELTYGIERLAMFLQQKDSALDTKWNEHTTWGDLYQESERQFTQYHLHDASSAFWLEEFDRYEKEAIELCKKKLPLVSYDFVLKSSHAFNSLEALGTLSTTQRASYISRIRNLAQIVAKSYIENREALGWPLYEKQTIKTPALKPAPKLQQNDDLLIEIGSEEMPATYIENALHSFQKEIEMLLKNHDLHFDHIESFATPRRLALLIKNVDFATKDKKIEKKGPRLSALFNPEPTRALQGFLQSIGETANSIEEIKQNPSLSIIQIDGQEYLSASKIIPSIGTSSILQQHLSDIVKRIRFPKKMRWSESKTEYARPIRWLLVLYGKQVIEIAIDDVVSSNQTYGHRFLAPEVIAIDHASNYEAKLEKVHVTANIEKRRKSIEKQIETHCEYKQLNIVKDDSLLTEVTQLVESPFLLEGQFDPAFLQLPKELLISEMKEHQRVFAVTNHNGKLENRFLIISNVQPTKEIQQGNEKVIASRLYDGKFLYEEDKKTTLKEFRKKLSAMIFQQELGSMLDKTNRIVKHLELLYASYPKANLAHLKQAALDAKSDLASGVVFEFPHLQGVMGANLARIEGADEKVAIAIEEHYFPASEQGALPQSKEGILLSIADKLDSLMGLFAVGKKPTSSNDPFALRRAAIGISRMIVQHALPLQLKDLMKKMAKHFSFPIKESVIEEVYQFIVKRFQGILSSMQFEMSNLTTIRLNQSGDLHDYLLRIKGLYQAMENNDFESLKEVLKRSHNLTKNYKQSNLKPDLFEDPYEIELFNHFTNVKKEFESHLLSSHYDQALLSLAKLQNPMHNFFENVRVMSDNNQLKDNRLALLRQIFDLSQQIFN